MPRSEKTYKTKTFEKSRKRISKTNSSLYVGYTDSNDCITYTRGLCRIVSITRVRSLLPLIYVRVHLDMYEFAWIGTMYSTVHIYLLQNYA